MKKITLFTCLIIGLAQGAFAGHIIKAPGSTTDIYSELSMHGDSGDALDTLFVEGGTGDITLQGGPSDNTSYDWDIDGGSLTTWKVTFTYAHATVTLDDGSKGRIIRCSRMDGLGGFLGRQYIWVVYRTGPLKPSTPSGSASVCKGTSVSYSASSTNADAYVWTIEPASAGTTSSTSGTASIQWSSSWTGTASVSVKGKKDSYESPASDALSVTVGQAPAKPVITGDSFVKVGTTLLYTATNDGTANWSLSNALATKTASGNNVSLAFGATAGSVNLTVSKTNTCGTSPLSDALVIEIADPAGLQAQITTKDAQIATKDAQIVSKDAQIATLTAQVNSVYHFEWSTESSVITKVYNTTTGNFSVSLYPNPTPGEVTVTSNEVISLLEVINNQGQTVLQQTPNAATTTFVLTRQLAPMGISYVRITTAKGQSTHKIVISQ